MTAADNILMSKVGSVKNKVMEVLVPESFMGQKGAQEAIEVAKETAAKKGITMNVTTKVK